ncbi:MAG: efflux RND transporter periplasmic adaptor subunit [SAR202 cluster bacterium]|jgi:RND family efflux transporter MFP subunit|nr:efflux RND transporter periplasmic adaptor subunit [SAR202 cluster bacterium]
MFSTFKGWQIGVLVGVVVAVAAGTYGAITFIGDSGETNLEADEQLIPVQLGDLINEVSVNGSVLFPNRETLVFGSQGTVAELLVAEGLRVGTGEPLATFDSETIANLDRSVAQARVSLRNAQDSLEDLQMISDLEIAQVESKVSSAKMTLNAAIESLDLLQNIPDEQMFKAKSKVSSATVSLMNAEESLAQYLAHPTAQELASAESKVTAARLSLEKAEDALEDLQGPSQSLDLAQAEARVTDAQLAERTAQEKLDEFKAGPTEADKSDARNVVTSAETQLANANAELNVGTSDWDDKVDAAESDFQTKTEDYQNQFKTWLGIDLDSSELNDDATDALASLGVDLEVVFNSDSQFGDLVQGGYYSQGLAPDDPSTSWDESVVFTWQNFSPTQIVGSCDSTAIPAAAIGFCVSHEFDKSASAYRQSGNSLESLKAQSAKAIAALVTNVDKAEDGLATAQEALGDVLGPIDSLSLDDKQRDLDVASASLLKAIEDLSVVKEGTSQLAIDNQVTQVDLAKSNLQTAIDDLAGVKADTDPAVIENQRNQVGLATATLADAQAELELLQNGGDPVELETKLLEVEVASLNLADKEQELADLLQGPDILELAVSQANVVSALAALADAEDRLANSVITAPWDGVITFINAETGQSINANTPIMEIVDTSVVEIDGVVDEIDVLFVQVGSSALVTMDAIPGEFLQGEVSFIATTPDTQQGVVSFPIRIRVSLPQGLDVPEGLSAVANVVIREDRGVLMVPINSLYGSFDEPTVKVVSDGRVLDRPVVLGNSDDFWIVVSEGIAEGDLVIMESEGAQSNQFNFGGNFRRASGGISVIGGPGNFTGGGRGGRGGGGGR